MMGHTYRHRYFAEVTTYAVLHDTPQVDAVVGSLRYHQTPLSFWTVTFAEAIFYTL